MQAHREAEVDFLRAGDANGDAATPTARNMAESKLSAFGLPISRSLLMRQRSGGVPPRCGGRPPLAPMSPEPPSSATSSSRSLNVGQGAWSLTAEPCTSGYETPTQVALDLHASVTAPGRQTMSLASGSCDGRAW